MSWSSRNSEKSSSRNDFYRGDNNKTERRTLFNPQSDNPMAFNTKPSDDDNNNSSGSNSSSQRSYSSQRRRQGLEQQQQQQQRSVNTHASGNRPPPSASLADERSSRSSPGRPSRGVLWDPNSNPIPQRAQPLPPPPQQQQKTSPQQQPRGDVNTTTTSAHSSSTSSSSAKKGPGDDTVTMTPKEQEHRTQLKTFLGRIQKLQTKITQVDETTTADHPYFQGIYLDPNGSSNSHHRRRPQQQQRGHIDSNDDDAYLYDRQQPPPIPPQKQQQSLDPVATHPWLTMTEDSPLWQSTEQIWKDKMQLHLQLANAYLDIIQYDDVFAETKHLTSLCWKRAIYSLVEQFRQAFARQQGLTAAVAAAAAATTTTTTTTTVAGDSGSQQQKPATTMMDDDDDDDGGDFIPVMTENGMTMVQLSDSDDDDDDEGGETDKASLQRIMSRHLVMLRIWMDTFLLVADTYYQRVMMVLRDLEKDEAGDLETSLHSWRRTRRWKWYRCIPYRGDLARYRFIYGQIKGDYALAWRWYSLGVWMIPATGRFYFHQSLLLNSPKYSPLYELHKLYFGVRSLMVRRNGFVNAREGLVTLFENNRQWHTATTMTIGKKNNNSKGRRLRRQLQSKDEDGGSVPKTSMMVVEPDNMISGLFIRLHGMLFTKINLDAFTETKRRYFDSLFPSTTSVTCPTYDQLQQLQQSPTTLSCQHLFWLETIVLNLSSLYNYDYASSTLTKALTLNKTYWIAKHEEEGGETSKTQQQQQQQNGDWKDVLETLDDSLLFGHSIDLICQVVVELISRFMNNDLDLITSLALPALPPVVLNLKANESLLFGTEDENGSNNSKTNGGVGVDVDDAFGDRSWLIYIYVLLHWMVVTGIGVTGGGGDGGSSSKSIWESVIGQVATKATGQTSNNMDKITRSFWPLLMTFMTRLLQDLPEPQRYQVIDRHLLDTNNPWATDEHEGGGSGAWDDYIIRLMGPCPILPEDEYLRGLGWLDETLCDKNDNKSNAPKMDGTTAMDMDLQRRIRILDYGFTLVKQMHQTLEYDPVEEAFIVKPPPSPLVEEEEKSVMVMDEDDDTDMLPILTAMDDAVLFDSTNELVGGETLQDDNDVPALEEEDEIDDDDMMGQLKKRRQHLQSMLATMTEEKRHAATYGYQKLPIQRRGKEREARLNRIREKVIPGQTVLVLDTNCFIGHMDSIKRLIDGGAWSIIVPLVVITELDGLKGNAAPLGTVAEQALRLIETALASKQPRPDAIRIQTSHHNFMYNISIRSEQFIFGETDKNLDDLILSTCLWWNNNKKQQPVGVPVCLVTADRNLSVKARARDVQVIPVSGLMEINPSSSPL